MTLKLPDFTKLAELNTLRTLMSAPLVTYDPGDGGARRISRRDLERLQTTGIIVDLRDIDTVGGTFSYQGVPVLLYIMSVKLYKDTQKRPKFHVSNCSTWDMMKIQGRQDRYVASTRVDGFFELEITGLDGRSRRVTEPLEVCKNCLDNVSWKGFDYQGMLRSERNRIFRAFSLAEFFEVRKRTLIKEKPRWSPRTYPGGSYTDDFEEVSSRARAAAKWRCQGGCNRLFATGWQRRYLHVHHKNGVPGDNSPENLMVVCLGCHAKQPNHSHLRRSKDYAEFHKLFGDIHET
jgi:hypothetical protein